MLTCLRLRNANVPNERSFQGLSKTCNLSLQSISETEKYALKRPDSLSESYKGKTKKSGNFCKILIFSFLRALLLLETAVIALIWIMIQLEAFLMPLLATVLQLKEHFNQRLPK